MLKADYRKPRDATSASRSRTSSPADSKPRKASGAAKEDLRTKAQKAEAAMLKRMEAKKAKEAPVLGSEVRTGHRCLESFVANLSAD